LTEAFGDISGNPAKGPRALPWARVRARIVDCHFVPKLVVRGPREPFGEVQAFGVRQAAVRKPEPRIEAGGLRDERVTFPVSDGEAVERESDFIGIRRRAPIEIDHAPAVIAAAEQ